MHAIPDFAVTGLGLSSYRYVFPIYRSFGGTIAYSWAHNDYLQVVIELGLPGLLLVLWIDGGSRVSLVSRSEEDAGNSALLHLHAGYLAACVALALYSFMDFSLHLAANAALLSIVVGVAIGLEGGEKERSSILA